MRWLFVLLPLLTSCSEFNSKLAYHCGKLYGMQETAKLYGADVIQFKPTTCEEIRKKYDF